MNASKSHFRAFTLHWRVAVTHPANQTGTHLAEELEIKVPDARIELTTFEEVIQHVSWWREGTKLFR